MTHPASAYSTLSCPNPSLQVPAPPTKASIPSKLSRQLRPLRSHSLLYAPPALGHRKLEAVLEAPEGLSRVSKTKKPEKS